MSTAYYIPKPNKDRELGQLYGMTPIYSGSKISWL
jgi:hypothetical protein